MMASSFEFRDVYKLLCMGTGRCGGGRYGGGHYGGGCYGGAFNLGWTLRRSHPRYSHYYGRYGGLGLGLGY